MKYKITEKDSNNKRRYWFAVNSEELEVLVGLTNKAQQYTPNTPESRSLITRLENLSREFGKAVRSAKEADQSLGMRLEGDESK